MEESADLTLQALKEAINRHNDEAPETLRLAPRYEQLDSHDSIRLHRTSLLIVFYFIKHNKVLPRQTVLLKN